MVGSQIGINVLHPDVEVFIRKLAELEYSHVYFGSSKLFSQPDDVLERIAGFCQDQGITPFAAHAPGQFLPGDEDKLPEMIAWHKQVLDKAALLGCGSVTFHIASVEGVDNEDRFQQTFQFIGRIGMAKFDEMNFYTVRELALHAQQKGMRIAVENLSRDIVANYCRTVDDLKRIIQGAGQPNVGICIDTGHAHISGLKAAEMIREAGELLIETHFNDNFGWLSPVNAVNDIHRPPGIGTVDWLQVVGALAEIGYEKPIIFELGFRGEGDDLDAFLRLTRDNWRLILQAWRYVQEGLAAIP